MYGPSRPSTCPCFCTIAVLALTFCASFKNAYGIYLHPVSLTFYTGCRCNPSVTFTNVLALTERGRGGWLGRAVNVDPTVRGTTWSRAFRQNPMLKGLTLTRHCFGLPHLFLKTEATQDLKVKSTQRLTVPKPWGVFNCHFWHCPMTIKEVRKGAYFPIHKITPKQDLEFGV